MQWLQLIARFPQILNLIEKILNLLSDKSKEAIAKNVADKIVKEQDTA
jgi:hypothetical protein